MYSKEELLVKNARVRSHGCKKSFSKERKGSGIFIHNHRRNSCKECNKVVI